MDAGTPKCADRANPRRLARARSPRRRPCDRRARPAPAPASSAAPRPWRPRDRTARAPHRAGARCAARGARCSPTTAPAGRCAGSRVPRRRRARARSRAGPPRSSSGPHQVHVGRRDPQHADPPRRALGRPLEAMLGVWRLVPGAGRARRHLDPAVDDPDLVARHPVGLEPWFAVTGVAMELPAVPRTHDVLALERAVAERSTDVVARARDRREDPIAMRQGHRPARDGHLLQRYPGELRGVADVDPLERFHGAMLPAPVWHRAHRGACDRACRRRRGRGQQHQVPEIERGRRARRAAPRPVGRARREDPARGPSSAAYREHDASSAGGRGPPTDGDAR